MDSSIVESTRYPGFYLVSTTDFFYPLVQDPYIQGRIACANVLSDVYACGISHVDSMLMLLSVSLEMGPQEQRIITSSIMKGFSDCAREAGTRVTGGQTVKNPWPIVGGVAKSLCRREDIVFPDGAMAGDVLVLTKPLGTQVAVNAKVWMLEQSGKLGALHGIVSEQEMEQGYRIAEYFMARLNRTAAEQMHVFGARACTDVTGFGILGHAQNLSACQKESVDMEVTALPIIRGMHAIDQVHSFRLAKGYSSETSGGLIIAFPSIDQATEFIAKIRSLGELGGWVVGSVVSGSGEARLAADVEVIHV